MMKKGVCFILCFMLGLSMIAPAFVRADEPTPTPTPVDYEGFDDLSVEEQAALAVIGNLLILNYSVKAGSEYVGDNIKDWLKDEIIEPVMSRTGLAGSYYTNKQINQLYENFQNLHLHSSGGHRFSVDVDNNTILSLVGNNFQNYNNLALSVEADEFPSYVPVEYRNALSEINRTDDLNFSGVLYGISGGILTNVDTPDISKTIFNEGNYYFNSDRSVMRGLFYYRGMYDTLYNWLYKYELNASAYPGYYTFQGPSGYGYRYPTISLYNDRYKVLIPPDTEWGEGENNYTLNMDPWTGYNEDSPSFRIDFADISARKVSGSSGVQQELNFTYRNVGSETEYNGSSMIGSLAFDATGSNSYFVVSNVSQEATPSIQLYVQKQTNDKLLDTMWRLSDSFRNVDVYVGNDWATATLWYQAVQTGTEFIPLGGDVLPGNEDPTPLIHMPSGKQIDLLQLYLFLKHTMQPNQTITINNITNQNTYNVFPDENGDPAPVIDVTPATIMNNPEPTDSPEDSEDPDIEGVDDIDRHISFMYDDEGVSSGLWSSMLAYDAPVTPTPQATVRLMKAAAVADGSAIGFEDGSSAVGSGNGRADSPVTGAVRIVQVATAFLGSGAAYIWYIVVLGIIASLVVKFLHS